MPDYKELYYQLAGVVANAVDLLIEAQLKGEYTVIESEDAAVTLLHNKEDAPN